MRKSVARQHIIGITLLLLVSFLFCGNAMAATAQEIDAKVDATLKIFRAQIPGASQYLSVAKGVLVFPSVFRAGVGIGGEYGEGALRINGKTVKAGVLA
jgi:lipid-binding SYLF domain-containing protein